MGRVWVQRLQDSYGNATVDAVWLVVSLTYGIPMVAFLLMTNLSTFAFNGQDKFPNAKPHMHDMRTGFTLALVAFILIGLTVHFWNYVWIFWAINLGIRASFREQTVIASARAPFELQHASRRWSPPMRQKL